MKSLSYLLDDWISFYQILVKVNKTLFYNFNINITKCLTISKLTYKLFIKNYLIENKPILVINKRDIYNNIKLKYYKNIIEVFKLYKKRLYYYNINFLYLYKVLNNILDLKYYKLIYLDINKNIKELFGFFYYNIKAFQEIYLSVLLIKIKDGNIYFICKWLRTYINKKLKYAKENDYKINIK